MLWKILQRIFVRKTLLSSYWRCVKQISMRKLWFSAGNSFISLVIWHLHDTKSILKCLQMTSLNGLLEAIMSPSRRKWLGSSNLSLNGMKRTIQSKVRRKENECLFYLQSIQMTQIQWKSNNDTLVSVKETKFLGVILDQGLTMKPHWMKMIKEGKCRIAQMCCIANSCFGPSQSLL